jgi:hypothetical protein
VTPIVAVLGATALALAAAAVLAPVAGTVVGGVTSTGMAWLLDQDQVRSGQSEERAVQ